MNDSRVGAEKIQHETGASYSARKKVSIPPPKKGLGFVKET